MSKAQQKDKIIAAVKAGGGLQEFAQKIAADPGCNVTEQKMYWRIQKWIDSGVIPPGFVLLVERHSGVSRHELSPIIYGARA